MHIAIIERVTRRLAFTVKSPKLNEKEKEEKKKKKKTARNELSLFKVEEERRGVIQGV